MTEFNLTTLQPWEARLKALGPKHDGLVVTDLDDEEGYEELKEVISDYVSHRTGMEKEGKKLREESNAFSKKVIERAKELKAISEPKELEFKGMKEKIDDGRLKRQRKILLPGRKEELSKINIKIPDDELLLMDLKEYKEFHDEKKLEYFNKKEAEEEARKKKIQDEKTLETAKKEGAKEVKKEIKVKQKKAIESIESIVNDFLDDYVEASGQDEMDKIKTNFINNIKKLING